MKMVLENYESIHVELKRELNVDYEGMYGGYGEKVRMMTHWIKEAKKEIRAKKLSMEKEEREERLRIEEKKLRLENKKLEMEKEDKEERMRIENEYKAKQEE